MFNFREMHQSSTTAASSVFSAYASFATTMMMIRSMTNEVLPPQFKSFLSTIFRFLFSNFSSQIQTTFIFDEFTGHSKNDAFEIVDTYLRSKITPSLERIKVHKNQKHKNFILSIDQNQTINDSFENIRLQWRFVSKQQGGGKEPRETPKAADRRHFELVFNTKFRDKIVDFYLPFILTKANQIKEGDKVNKIFSQDSGGCKGNWGSVNQEHPANFETVAMDPELKKSIIDDLDRFVKRKEFYKRVGKAWKRGYLLYGPPGTGKSSLIAAMANYLKFDIYDLDLTNIYSNSDLRRVLLCTSNRSILVIEDIDCSVDIGNRKIDYDFKSDRPRQRFTLSGMLNFIDGLWSSCGDERIIIFTTNHKDRLDPALLRPGRMDFHIHMSYCTVQAFKVLARNYLGDNVTDHCLYGEIEGLIGNIEVTPAEVAEELMKSDDVDVTLNGLATHLKGKIKEEKKTEVRYEEKSFENGHGKEEIDCDIVKKTREN